MRLVVIAFPRLGLRMFAYQRFVSCRAEFIACNDSSSTRVLSPACSCLDMLEEILHREMDVREIRQIDREADRQAIQVVYAGN
ncbi:hypothetical protein E2C01_090917 [Portunus trituberculatus]|uniref:Uncharacterized protein n=1 Tax=Portunus trituberculatus TaxID=210409 RepID=A0A5B7JTP4_PORTR|nr:hypothetical protein [Portunus trituberculatus]